MNGHIGAAAVAPSLLSDDPSSFKRTQYMGQASASTVYAAEIRAITMACHIALEFYTKTNTTSTCIVFTDSQAALQAMASPKCSSGQHTLIEAIRALDNLRSQGFTVELRWIPAHTGVPGNEIADQAAKAAAQQTTAPLAVTVTAGGPHPEQTEPDILVSTVKTTLRKTLRDEWTRHWDAAEHGRDLYRLGVRPGKGTVNTHKGIHRAIISVITQMRHRAQSSGDVAQRIVKYLDKFVGEMRKL